MTARRTFAVLAAATLLTAGLSACAQSNRESGSTGTGGGGGGDTFTFGAALASYLQDYTAGSNPFASGHLRLVDIFGVGVEADLSGAMLYIVNEDAPGFIGRLGTTLGQAGVNIGTFHLGRRNTGGEAVLLLSLDEPVGEELLAKVKALPGVKTVMALRF